MAVLAVTGHGGEGDSKSEDDDQTRRRGKEPRGASVSGEEDEGWEHAEVEDGSSDPMSDKEADDTDDTDDDEEEEERGGSEQEEEEDEDGNLADIVARSIASRLRGINSESSTMLAMEESKRRRRDSQGSLPAADGLEGIGNNGMRNPMLRWFPETGIALPGRREGEGENGSRRLNAVVDRRRGGGGERELNEKNEDSKITRAVVRQSATIACNALEQAMAVSSTDARLDPTLEKKFVVPPPDPKKERRMALKSAPKTAGSRWYNLPAPQLTPELKRELQLIKLRSVIDPKRHYKTTNDTRVPYPTYFQIGKVIEGPTEFYSSRLTKKQRKQTMAEEILADEAVTAFRKRKFTELQKIKAAGGKDQYKSKFMKRKKPWARH